MIEVPDWYRCHECNASGVKLWFEGGIERAPLWCRNCAYEREAKARRLTLKKTMIGELKPAVWDNDNGLWSLVGSATYDAWAWWYDLDGVGDAAFSDPLLERIDKLAKDTAILKANPDAFDGYDLAILAGSIGRLHSAWHQWVLRQFMRAQEQQ